MPASQDIWSKVLDQTHQRLAKLDPADLRRSIDTPIMFDDGSNAPGNPRLEGILTLASWAGLGLGGIAAIVTAFFTTGPVLWVLVGIAVVSLLYLLYEASKNSRNARPWYESSTATAGCLLVANDDLFEPGERILPGGMLVTFDEDLAADAPRIIEMTERFMRYYGEEEPTPPDLKDAVAWIDSDVIEPSFQRFRLPTSFAENDRTWLVCLGMSQDTMPNRCIDRTLWPVFGREGRNEPVVLLPHKLWYQKNPRLDAITRGESA